MKQIALLLRRHPFVGGAFLLALCATIYFGVSTALFAIYWSDPAHRNLEIEAWMTPGYVAHSWQVPREIMQGAIGPLPDGRRPTLDAIAADQGIDLETLVARIEAAIVEHRQAKTE